MDRSSKKKFLNEYKQRELVKLSQSEDKVWAAFAKNKLGLKSEHLDAERLKNVSDDKLIDVIIEKINEVIGVRYKDDPQKYKHANNVIHELNKSLRAIHFTNIFEMYVEMGDTKKFLEGATSVESAELIDGYQLLRLTNISDNISTGKIDDIEKELSNKDKILRTKIEYIKGHLKEFELN